MISQSLKIKVSLEGILPKCDIFTSARFLDKLLTNQNLAFSIHVVLSLKATHN